MENTECLDMEIQLVNKSDNIVSQESDVKNNGIHETEEEKKPQNDVTEEKSPVKLVNGSQKPNQYRLVIQIDKVRMKPGPKSKKLLRLKKIRNKLTENVLELTNILSKDYSSPQSDNSEPETIDLTCQPVKEELSEQVSQPDVPFVIEKVLSLSKSQIGKPENVQHPCANGCKLESGFYNRNKFAYCCRCNKAFVQKRVQMDKKHRCLICNGTFESAQVLTEHIKTHSTCGTCGIECQTKNNLEAHKMLHVGRPPHFPFKCHLCTEVFRKEEHVRSHLTNKHYLAKHGGSRQDDSHLGSTNSRGQNVITQTLIQVQHPLKYEVHRCIPCNITFKNEEAFVKHAASHTSLEGRGALKTDNSVAQSPFGQLCAVKFTCRVCSQELSSVAEIDAHTKSHMKEEEEIETYDLTVPDGEDLETARFGCSHCLAKFNNGRDLMRHTKLHTGNS